MRIENFQFKKFFGQNFIFDDNLLSKIVVDAGVTDSDNVLEIGAGAGTLTEKLAKKAKKVIAYEIDKTLTEHLSALASKYENLKIIIKDALKTPVEEIELDFKDESYVIVANLPYYITSPLIFKFIEETKKASSITVMVQKEVAQRFTASPNSKEYGIATIMLNYYADVKYLRTVTKKVFRPIPKVDSALIQIFPNSKKEKAEDEVFFKKLVQSAFSMRRKTLLNNLKSLNIDKEKLIGLLEKINKPISVRAEELSISHFIFLSNNLS